MSQAFDLSCVASTTWHAGTDPDILGYTSQLVAAGGPTYHLQQQPGLYSQDLHQIMLLLAAMH